MLRYSGMASQITDRKLVRRTESSLGAASDGVSHYDDFLVKLSIVRCSMMESRSRAWDMTRHGFVSGPSIPGATTNPLY